VNDREMYYNAYGYNSAYPMMQGFMPYNMPGMNQYNSMNQNDSVNDINNRLNRIERQIRRLEQRISRLETPYSNNTTNIYNDQPDSSMYML